MMLDKSLLDRLYRYCIALTADEDDAWDLLQTAVEKYLRARPADVRNQYAYLVKIARRQRLDDLRKNKTVGYETFDEIVHTETETTLEQTLIYREQLETAWRLLTMAEREVLFLWAAEGFSAQEIALRLEIPRGTVLARLFRARKKIITHQSALEREAK